MNGADFKNMWHVLGRIAYALERSADADERRNELVVLEADERRAAWARSEARQEEQFEAILAGPPKEIERPEVEP